VTFAFLLALEALSARAARRSCCLRDVFDYSVREAADALGMSEANVKTTHLRARRVMDVVRCAARGSRGARRRPLGPGAEQLLTCLATRDDGGPAGAARQRRALDLGRGRRVRGRAQGAGRRATRSRALTWALQTRAGRVACAWPGTP
jgi:RNA polymerase sigma-70 factor (ECF subfamily)